MLQRKLDKIRVCSDGSHWEFPMNVRSEPKVRPTLDPGEPASSLTTQVKRGMKSRKEDDFGYREMEMSETHINRSLEVAKCETPKSRNRRIAWSVGYRDFGYREMEMSKTHIIRSPEVPKCENPK
jgi:hypothetical protein